MILGLADQAPIFVEATGASYLTEGVEDIVEGSLGFENGLTARLSVSWFNPLKEQRLTVIGTERMVVFDDTAPWSSKLTVYNHKINWKDQIPEAIKDEVSQKIPFEPVESLKEQCRTFLGCVESRTQPPDSHGLEALEVMKVLLRLDLGLKKGKKEHDGGSALAKSPVTEPGAPLALPDVPQEDGSGFFVHPTAAVDAGVKIGSGVKVWHFSHILGGTEIGPGTNIGQNVVIGPKVVIGAGCKIQNNVSVYEGVTLEDAVFCGPSMVFTNVHNPRAFIPRMNELRPTHVGFGATIGANATIVCGNNLGRFCLIGAGSVITDNVPDHALMAGVPARRIGWVCRCGVKLSKSLVCQACGLAYREEEGGLRLLPTGGLDDCS
jgi:UDP-2-acetamido-3-amino-2,3-dideoxy-glucuronate N-acetyltransferase